MTPVPGPTVEAMQSLLVKVSEGLARQSVDAWHPVNGPSPARTEVNTTEILMRSDGVTPWGQAPIEAAWKASELLYVAVLEYARATAALLVPPFRTWAPSATTRSALEAAGQALWLLDPNISGRTRVGRYFTLRLRAAHRLAYSHGKVGRGDPLHIYGMPAADVEAHAAILGLDPVRDKGQAVIGYEKQQAAQIEDLVKAIVGDNGAYSVLSGAAHSEFWSLLGGYQNQGPSPLGVSAEQQEGDAASFVPVVRACIQAMLKPIDHASAMFDRRFLADNIERIYADVVAVMDA